MLIPTAISQDSALLYKICRNNSQNYTSTFAKNLKSLLDDLYINTPRNDGFWKAQHGQAYGLALCRGDVSPDDCDFCLYDARCKITQRCNKPKAIVWYDYCYLKYSDYDFFGEIDNKNKVYLWNTDNATTDPQGFNATVRGLLSNISGKAIKTARLFASGQKYEEKENATIYGMAQCSRDLSKGNCTRCLQGAVNELPGFTTKTSPIGGRTLTGSCNVRYETYTFLNDQPKTV
ncbi:cysteine-rich repeat secretory protein 38 [Phtheirospermum japonicum]|uniref:Cysteine-rich repeat secretory protein 38 n=1 Tax=Phtheirospermum japonicum TaxID=374723 RepID=A0A830CNW1_9LAMI|nr:cysteine-rich repeat secretory protein 38 [Phtheirospermum japonicum]